MSVAADFSRNVEEGHCVLKFRGNLTILRVRRLTEELAEIEADDLVVDLSDVERMDTVGAWLVHKLQRDRGARIIGANREQQLLIDHVTKADQPVKMKRDYVPPFFRVVGEVGAAVLSTGRTCSACSASSAPSWSRPGTSSSIRAAFGSTRSPAVQSVGARARDHRLMSFLVGIVIAEQGAVQLRRFGAEIYTINLIGRSALKELGVLMTAIMVAGRSGSAFAAQLGSMKLSEEVDAMRTIGVSPMEALVFPRVAATVLLMPLLGFYAAILATIGGGIFCWISLEIPPISFIQRLREVVPMTDLYQTLIKAPVFGIIIAMAGCYQGLQVKGNAEEVGLRTTAAVVQGIFLVIVLDAFFAVFFTEIGWV